jgi:hypothetical protein
VHRANVQTHIWVGRRELAREWRVEMSGNKQAAVVQSLQTKHAFVLFARSLRLRAESTRSRHDVCTRFVQMASHIIIMIIVRR